LHVGQRLAFYKAVGKGKCLIVGRKDIGAISASFQGSKKKREKGIEMTGD